MMALLESLTVWHEDDYKLTEILPFASLVIKLRKEGWKQKCKWSIETSPNALQLLVRPKLPVAETVPYVSMANVLSVTRDSPM